MKRIIQISLIFIYVFFNAGMSYSLHFCGEEIKRINFFAEYKTCCESNVPMPGCCDDVFHLDLPNSDQQLTNHVDFEAIQFDIPSIIPSYQNHNAIALTEQEVLLYSDTSPPILKTLPLHIFYQVFLI